MAPRSTSGQVNVEELIVADPQLVIAGDLDGSIVEKKTRIPVAYFKSDMNQSYEVIKEENMKTAYGVDVRIVQLEEAGMRKACFPALGKSTHSVISKAP